MQHVVVLGAGIIGVCCAVHLRRGGARVTLVDPHPPGSQTSSGNAGGFGITEVVPMSMPGMYRKVPGWLFDPLGPLSIRWRHFPALIPWLMFFRKSSEISEVLRISKAQSRLLEKTYDDYKLLFRDAGAGHLMHYKGAITLYESEKAFNQDALEWQIKRDCGITVEEIDVAEAYEMEPALKPEFQKAIFAPDWFHTSDPYRLVSLLAELCFREGTEYLPRKVVDIRFRDSKPATLVSTDSHEIDFDSLVIAAGAWSGRFARILGHRVPLQSERGYNTTLPYPNAAFARQVIFAERKFVLTPMDGGLRIGGAAEFAGLKAPPDYRRSAALVKLAEMFVHGLEVSGGTRWMGHRPALPDSLPVISRSRRWNNIYFAFGHGHLGLTQGATTGRLIGQMVRGESISIDITPYTIERF